MLALALTASLLAAEPVDVLVIVPLCDGAQLACGNGSLGDPHDPEGNLYWGALYGARTFLERSKHYTRVSSSKDVSPAILREARYTRAIKGERALSITLRAYDGTKIDDALKDYLAAVETNAADLVVWAGHDRLMDVSAPAPAVARDGTSGAYAAVLACSSEQYFKPALESHGAKITALTRSFMAPEGYLIDALLLNVARHGPADRARLRDALVAAYAKYQRISPKAAATVFATLE
jgi:hypothetical protein